MKAAGKRETRGRVSLGAACVRYRTCPSLLQSGLDDIHTQTDRPQVLQRIDHVSVLSDTDDS